MQLFNITSCKFACSALWCTIGWGFRSIAGQWVHIGVTSCHQVHQHCCMDMDVDCIWSLQMGYLWAG